MNPSLKEPAVPTSCKIMIQQLIRQISDSLSSTVFPAELADIFRLCKMSNGVDAALNPLAKRTIVATKRVAALLRPPLTLPLRYQHSTLLLIRQAMSFAVNLQHTNNNFTSLNSQLYAGQWVRNYWWSYKFSQLHMQRIGDKHYECKWHKWDADRGSYLLCWRSIKYRLYRLFVAEDGFACAQIQIGKA